MPITLGYIKQLCLKVESDHLDYKQEQYPFVEVSAPEKAELLKDVLAMANTSRNEAAYILIGVAQKTGEKGQIVGIPKGSFIDDAKLQQFINEKTNRVVEFSSYSVEINSANIIQVIEIPVQRERPYFPKKGLGKIKENDVFIRVGSYTRLATPDEIALMGKEDLLRQNQREIEISLIVRQNISGDIDFHAVDISSPDYDNPDPTQKNPMVINPLGIVVYPLERLNWIRDIAKTIRVDIALENKSPLSAEQLKVDAFVIESSNNCIKEVNHFPYKPSESLVKAATLTARIPRVNPVLHPGEYDDSFDTLYFEVNHEGDFTLKVTVLGKDMPKIQKEFHVNVSYTPRTLDKKTIDSLFEYIQDEDAYLQLRKRVQEGSFSGE